GVIHTQAAYVSGNQNFARSLMRAGFMPQEIIDSMIVSDFWGQPDVRQYGIVKLVNGQPQAADYTGANCSDYKNHIIGSNYTIQGNSLLGQEILDSMEARFLNTAGNLACKLMAALQGAKVVGADTRCMASGNSSLSAFLRLAHPSDDPNFLWLDLVVPRGPQGFEPIDSLQKLFDQAMSCIISSDIEMDNKKTEHVKIFPNPATQEIVLHTRNVSSEIYSVQWFDAQGKILNLASVQE